MQTDLMQVNVAAGIIWQGDKFLAALRPIGKTRGGFWEFPGGKQEPGENMEETLRRELLEELDIHALTVVPWREHCHDYPDLRVYLHFMHVLSFSGLPKPQDGQILRWVSPNESQFLPFLPADKVILTELSKPRISA